MATDVEKYAKQYEEESGNSVEIRDSGLGYAVITEGTGNSPKPTDTVDVHYRGTLTSGDEFDSSYSRGESIQFPLNGVIAGWTEGVGLMKEGGKSLLICPPDLAYGNRALPGIPAGSTLVFEVELLSVM
jgi:FKBP-type peptidyl-prolyl cis-trans isomerase FkpA